jgi:hypothetical protein
MLIVVTACWILWDTAISVRMARMSQPFSLLECGIWFASGLLLAGLAIIAEIRERRAHDREMADLKTQIARGQTSHSGEHAALAEASIAIFQRLAAVTHTSGQPETEVLAAATARIEELDKQLTELKEDTRHVSREQRWRFGQAVPKVLPELFESPPRFEYKGVRVTYGSTIEAQNYAEELSRLFGENGLTSSKEEEFTHESLNTTGLKVLVADPSNPTENDKKTIELLKAAGIEYEVEAAVAAFPQITVLRVGRTVSR